MAVGSLSFNESLNLSREELIFQTSQNGNSEINNRGMYVINESGKTCFIYPLEVSEQVRPTDRNEQSKNTRNMTADCVLCSRS